MAWLIGGVWMLCMGAFAMLWAGLFPARTPAEQAAEDDEQMDYLRRCRLERYTKNDGYLEF